MPLAPAVRDAIWAHLARYPAADDGSIFTNGTGSPLTYEQWKRIWKPACDGFKAHDLRHYAASALISGGASVRQVQRILGHASAAVTLDVYSHLWPGDDERARTILNAAVEQAADSVRTSITA